MMKPTRPRISKGGTYPPEFREEAVRYWLSSGHSLKVVAEELGLTPESLRVWRKHLEATDSGDGRSPADSPNTSEHTSELALAREVGQLRRELEAMTRQRDILKKAISIFSDDKSLGGGLK